MYRRHFVRFVSSCHHEMFEATNRFTRPGLGLLSLGPVSFGGMVSVHGSTLSDARGCNGLRTLSSRAQHAVDAAIQVGEVCGQTRGGAPRTAALGARERAANVAVAIGSLDAFDVEAEARRRA